MRRDVSAHQKLVGCDELNIPTGGAQIPTGRATGVLGVCAQLQHAPFGSGCVGGAASEPLKARAPFTLPAFAPVGAAAAAADVPGSCRDCAMALASSSSSVRSSAAAYAAMAGITTARLR